MFHRRLEGVCAAELRIDHNEAYSPVYYYGKTDEEHDAGKQSSIAECIGLADDTRTAAHS